MNETLRREVKIIKALQKISYKEFSEYLGIKQSSFYSWVNGQYDLSADKIMLLNSIIQDIKE